MIESPRLSRGFHTKIFGKEPRCCDEANSFREILRPKRGPQDDTLKSEQYVQLHDLFIFFRHSVTLFRP